MWFVLFMAAALAYAAARVTLSVRVIEARRAGDLEREATLARRAFQLRVGWIGLVLIGLVVLLVVGLLSK